MEETRDERGGGGRGGGGEGGGREGVHTRLGVMVMVHVHVYFPPAVSLHLTG